MFLSIHKSIVLIETASKQFDVLKKRYSRKRQALKKASRSGSGAKETEAAQKDLEPYLFLSWLDDHVRNYRNTKSNLDSQECMQETNQESYENDEDVLEDSDIDETSSIEDGCTNTFLKSPVFEPAKKTLKKEKKASKKRSETSSAKMERDEIELELMSGMSKVIHSQLNKDGSVNYDDIFGQMVAAELKTFSEHIKFRVKHEINNVIFNFKAQKFQSCSLSSISSSASANQEYIQLPSFSSAPVNQAPANSSWSSFLAK